MPNQTPFAHRNLPLLLLKAREAVMQHRRPALRAHGLSDQQWRVLRVLAEPAHAQGLDTGRLAREAHLLGPSLTGVLARMERDGLIRRARREDDARRSVVQATQGGLALVESLSPTIGAHYDDIEAHMGQNKMAQLYALLDELIALQQSEIPEETNDMGEHATTATPLTEAAA